MHEAWDDNNVDVKAHILAYSQIRDYEDMKKDEQLYAAIGLTTNGR